MGSAPRSSRPRTLRNKLSISNIIPITPAGSKQQLKEVAPSVVNVIDANIQEELLLAPAWPTSSSTTTSAAMPAKKRKVTASSTAKAPTTMSFNPIQEAARRLHQRILDATTSRRSQASTQGSSSTAATMNATTASPPHSSLSSSRASSSSPPTANALASNGVSTANTSGEEEPCATATASAPLNKAAQPSTPQRRRSEVFNGITSSARPSTSTAAPGQPSLYEAIFGPQVASQLHQAAAVAEPKTPPPPSARSQRTFALTPATPSPASYRSASGSFRTPSTPQQGMSARLHKLSCTPQLGSPERARRGGPPVGIDPHNSPSQQHLDREDALAFAHPHQSYVLMSPSTTTARRVRKATSSPALSPLKRKRLDHHHHQDTHANSHVVNMLATMAEERANSRASSIAPATPRKASAVLNGAFADPSSITPRRAKVPSRSTVEPVTPPTRTAALPADAASDSNEANLLLYLANSPTVRQSSGTPSQSHHRQAATPIRTPMSSQQHHPQHHTPSLLSSLERRGSRTPQHGKSSVPRTLFPVSGSPNVEHRAETSSRADSPIAHKATSHGAAVGGLATSTSPITPPHSDRIKQSAPLGASSASNRRLQPMVMDTPPATPSREGRRRSESASPTRRVRMPSHGASTTTPRLGAAISAAGSRDMSRTSSWDTSSDEEDNRRRKRMASASRLTPVLSTAQRTPRSRHATADGSLVSQPPRTPSPAPTISSEPRTPHTPNTAAFTYSEYLNVSPSPNPRSRVVSATGRFPSCNGHLVGLEDAMTWDEAISRVQSAAGASGRRRGGGNDADADADVAASAMASTPSRSSRRRPSSAAHHRDDATDAASEHRRTSAMLTPGPILYESASPTFNIRTESRRARGDDEAADTTNSATHRARDSTTSTTSASSSSAIALPFDAGFKEGFGKVAGVTAGMTSKSNASGSDGSPTAAAADGEQSSNVGLGLSY